MAIIANIVYAEESSELIPLTEMGVDYVMRHGENSVGYYKLDYSKVGEYGYAFLSKEIFESELPIDLEWIDSDFYKKKNSLT